MSYWHPACKECVLSNGRCLFQDNNDVEECEEVQEYELKKHIEGELE